MGNKLANKVFISTRPAGQNNELAALLKDEGARLIEMPTIEIQPAKLNFDEEDMLQHINQFSWIVFSSPNGIRFFFEKLYEVNGSYYLPASIKIATVGSKTSSVLSEYGHETTLENPGNTGEDLGQELLKAINSEDFILFPQGNMARGSTASIVSQKAECINLVVYQNTLPHELNTEALKQIIKNQYDSILLTSPSSFNNLLKVLADKTDLKKLRLICIGTTTASEVVSKGIQPLSTAKMSTIDGIFESILETAK